MRLSFRLQAAVADSEAHREQAVSGETGTGTVGRDS